MSKQNPEGVPANLSERERQAQATGTPMITREDVEGVHPEVTTTEMLGGTTSAQAAADATAIANDERVQKLRDEEEKEAEEAAAKEAKEIEEAAANVAAADESKVR